MDKADDIKKRIIILIAALAAVAVGLAVIGITFYDFQKTVLDQQKQQMMTIAKSTAASIENYLYGYLGDLTTLASASELGMIEDGKTANTFSVYLRRYVDDNRSAVQDIQLEGPDGNILSSTCESAYRRHTASKGRTFSVYFDENETMALGISVVTSKGNVLTSFLDIKTLYENTASFATQIGEKGYVMIKTSDGLILMHPADPQIGKNVLTGRQEAYPDLDYSDLEILVRHQEEGRSAIEIYSSYWWGETPPSHVKKISAYTPAQVGDDFLIISAVTDYAELLQPMWRNFSMLLFATLLLIGGLSAFGVYIVRSRKAFLQENQYLRSLNKSLEEIRKTEEQLQHSQRLQLIGTLTGGIAHEFNNLLTPIMGYSGLLLEELPKEEPMREDVEEIYSASVKAKEIIQQIASLSRKSGDAVFKPVDLGEVLPRALKMARSAKPDTVELAAEFNFAGCSMTGNATQLSQVVLNLCTNAFHALRNTPDAKLSVIGSVEMAEGVQEAVIRFRDNGCGISEEHVRRIFDPFFTTKHAGEGTGLGLSIVQSIVAEHGGKITVQSTPGAGTEFCLRFPVGTAREPERSVGTEQPRLPAEVVLVEDDQKILRMLNRTLIQQGLHPHCFSDPGEALAWLREHPCGLLISDYAMPHTTGTELALRVRSIHPAMKILVLTAYLQREVSDAYQRKIINGYLQKPVLGAELIQKLSELFP